MSNESGIIPLGFKVLVRIQKIEEKTKGGIIIPTDTVEKESAASQIAEVIDFGQAAFTIGTGDLPDEWNVKPLIGAKVILSKYAGITIEGKDKEEYRLINDKEILAILSE